MKKVKLTKIAKLKQYKVGGLSETTIIFYGLLPKKFVKKYYKEVKNEAIRANRK